MSSPRVTVVVATYGRPDALEVALRTVQCQTYEGWRVLVVGDCCDAQTGRVVDEIGDPRIRYVNLPKRCNEQAWPNSIGVRLATTEFVAYLNHDDVWLPQHLEEAIASLDTAAAALFVARTAFAMRTVSTPAGERRPAFSDVTPSGRTLRQVFDGPMYLFEPASSWVFRRDDAIQVGDWRPRRELYRTPLQDWLLRAWRHGLQLETGEPVRVVKMNLHYQSDKSRPNYTWGVEEQRFCLRLLQTGDPHALEELILHDLDRAAVEDWPRRDWGSGQTNLAAHKMMPMTDEDVEAFLTSGRDPLGDAFLAAGIPRGSNYAAALKARTGEVPAPLPRFDEMMSAARDQLAQS